MYSPNAPGDGNVPRNMRLALAAIDLVQPSVVAYLDAGEQPAVALSSGSQQWHLAAVASSGTWQR